MGSEEAARMLQRKRERGCELWPSCSCNSTLAKYADELSDQEKIWDMSVLQWAETSIYITLSCVAQYCPDLAMKRYAWQQLQKSFWDRQRALDVHVEQ